MRSKRMRRSIIRRVLQFIPVLLGITFLAFLLIYLSPSDPVSVRMSAGGISVSPEIMESMRRSMGLDRPLLIQYGDWLWNILHGNMGKSYITDADVLDQILKALPYTLKMAGASLLLTLCISIPVGILTAAMQNSKFDYVVRVMAFVGNALPNFIIALCLMFIFSYRLGWIPVLATTKPIGLILPALTLALVMSSRYIRQIRAAMLDELGKVLRIGSDIDIVPRLQREAAVRDMHGAAALHHAHKHAHPRDLIQAVERDARQLGILAHMDLYDLHTALGKGIPLEK